MAFFILPLLSAWDLDIDSEGFSPRGDISRGLMTRAIWKRPCINLFVTYFARADNMLLPRKQITRHKLCFYYTCKFGVISIKYVINVYYYWNKRSITGITGFFIRGKKKIHHAVGTIPKPIITTHFPGLV